MDINYALVVLIAMVLFGQFSGFKRQIKLNYPDFLKLVNTNNLAVFHSPRSFFHVGRELYCVYNGKIIVTRYLSDDDLDKIETIQVKEGI